MNVHDTIRRVFFSKLKRITKYRFLRGENVFTGGKKKKIAENRVRRMRVFTYIRVCV